jgi:hypothetical protein
MSLFRGGKAYRDFPDPRGIPVVGRGMTSAIPGTDPLAALIEKERRGKLNLHVPDPIERPPPDAPHVRRRLGRRVGNQRHL